VHERAFDVVGPEGTATHCVTSPSPFTKYLMKSWLRPSNMPAQKNNQVGIGPGLPYLLDWCVKDSCENRIPFYEVFVGVEAGLPRAAPVPRKFQKACFFPGDQKPSNSSNSRQFVLGSALQVIGLNVKD
jgi:hypothetical protein